MSNAVETRQPETAEQARLLLHGLRALVRTQQISERADVSCCGMTVAQAATLQVLYFEGPMRAGALGARLGIAPSTLTRNVERIEDRGWVERVEDPDDGRAFRLRLTAAGRRQARQIERQSEGTAQRLLETLPQARRERAMRGLIDLLEALDRVAGECCPDKYRPIHDFLEARKNKPKR